MKHLLPLLTLCLMVLCSCTELEKEVSNPVTSEEVSVLETFEHYSPYATYVSEHGLSAQALDAYAGQPNVRVEHTHTFSNGEVYHYATQGQDVLSGDMILGSTKQLEKAIEEYEEQLKSGNSDEGLDTQGAIIRPYCVSRFIFCFLHDGQKWPQGIIYYEDSSIQNFNYGESRQILAAMRYIESVTVLTFRPGTSGSRIRFTKTAGLGCRSHVGMMGNAQDLNLESNYTCFGDVIPSLGFDGSIAHELLHAAGLIHEHQRQDRNQFVSVTSNDSNYAPTYSTIVRTGYDFGSIMHYSLSSSLQRIDYSQSYPDSAVGQRDRLSNLDVTATNTYY